MPIDMLVHLLNAILKTDDKTVALPPSWKEMSRVILSQVESPSDHTIINMLKAYDPSRVSHPGSAITAVSNADMERMRQAYFAIFSFYGEDVSSQHEDEVDSEGNGETPYIWSGWTDFSDELLEILRKNAVKADKRHWRDAKTLAEKVPRGHPLLICTNTIDPILVYTAREGGKDVLQKFIREPGVHGWTIPFDNLDRWIAVPLPITARGWWELLSSEDAPLPQRETLEVFKKLFEGIKSDDPDEGIKNAEMFFNVVRAYL